ncbi:hypothetical protein D3C83_56170 [compost metagenome]
MLECRADARAIEPLPGVAIVRVFAQGLRELDDRPVVILEELCVEARAQRPAGRAGGECQREAENGEVPSVRHR